MAFRVLIIGGTGQVGAAVVRAFVAEPSCAEVVMVNVADCGHHFSRLSHYPLQQSAQIDRPHHWSALPVSHILFRSARKNNHLNAFCGLQQ